MKPTFVAEIKTKSPFGFQSRFSFDTLLGLALPVADIISIHTDPRWGGSFSDIQKVRNLTGKPILAKGIHASDHEIHHALDCGANFVLVVGRIPPTNLLPKCWLEPYTISQLKNLPPSVTAVWNARDLDTGFAKLESWDQARAAWSGPLCQASYINSITDIKPDADLFLVGERMPDLVLNMVWSGTGIG